MQQRDNQINNQNHPARRRLDGVIDKFYQLVKYQFILKLKKCKLERNAFKFTLRFQTNMKKIKIHGDMSNEYSHKNPRQLGDLGNAQSIKNLPHQHKNRNLTPPLEKRPVAPHAPATPARDRRTFGAFWSTI